MFLGTQMTPKTNVHFGMSGVLQNFSKAKLLQACAQTPMTVCAVPWAQFDLHEHELHPGYHRTLI